MVARFDSMLAGATSGVEPLRHQLRAVYGELIHRTPLRYLLAGPRAAFDTLRITKSWRALWNRAGDPVRTGEEFYRRR